MEDAAPNIVPTFGAEKAGSFSSPATQVELYEPDRCICHVVSCSLRAIR